MTRANSGERDGGVITSETRIGDGTRRHWMVWWPERGIRCLCRAISILALTSTRSCLGSGASSAVLKRRFCFKGVNATRDWVWVEVVSEFIFDVPIHY